MPCIIFAGVNGRFDLLKDLLKRFPDSTFISIGDFNLFGEKTRVDNFCANKYLSEAIEIKRDFAKFDISPKSVFHIYGSRDDISIEQDSTRKGILLAPSVINVDTERGKRRVYALPGYYNYQSLTDKLPSTPKESLLLSPRKIFNVKNEILSHNNADPRILVSYESPNGFPFLGRGCPNLSELVDIVDLWIYGHHNVLSISGKIIGIPDLDKCYCVLRPEIGFLEVYYRFTVLDTYQLYSIFQTQPR